MVPWQGNLHGRAKPQQRRDGAGDETGRLGWEQLVGARSAPDNKQPAVGGGLAGG